MPINTEKKNDVINPYWLLVLEYLTVMQASFAFMQINVKCLTALGCWSLKCIITRKHIHVQRKIIRPEILIISPAVPNHPFNLLSINKSTFRQWAELSPQWLLCNPTESQYNYRKCEFWRLSSRMRIRWICVFFAHPQYKCNF